MKRSKFSLSHYKLLTCEQGNLVPIACFEVLPGDTVQHATSALIRVTPLVAPVMHPVQVRIHHWFVPYRIIWDGFENFITGGPDGMDATQPPHIAASTVSKGSLADYLGVPPGTYTASDGQWFSALPFRAYASIFNEHYRDQDLVGEIPLSTANGFDSITNTGIQKVAWEKDRFTSARPWTQKGPDVSLPLGTTAPVRGEAGEGPQFTVSDATLRTLAASSGAAGHTMFSPASAAVNAPAIWADPNLYADLTSATATNINAVRRAFALQRYEEARARYGSRYTEYLRYLGVRSSDARLQRPEYLGGGKQTIQFSEVLQTAPVDGTGVGSLSGHGIGAMRSNRYRRFFEEHGVVLSLLSVKPRTMYTQRVHPSWFRKVKEDYFQRELQHIGQAAILNREIYATHAAPTGVFGYQDRYDEYRRAESGVAGDFHDTLDHWHYARIFASAPTLNWDFVTANPTKRVYQEQTAHPLWIMTNHSIQARRMLAPQGTSHIF